MRAKAKNWRKLLLYTLSILILACLGVVAWSFFRRDPFLAASRSVATIKVLDESGKAVSQGSGFLVNDSGAVATNFHVVEGGTRVRVEFADGAVTETSTLLAADEFLDLAVLGTDVRSVRGLEISQKSPSVGDDIVVVGSPLGLSGTISKGSISGKREVAGVSLYQITAAISSGSSGGPVLDRRGRVIGLATASIPSGQSINFAVPATDLIRLIGVHRGELRQLGRVGINPDLLALNDLESRPRNPYPRFPISRPKLPPSITDTILVALIRKLPVEPAEKLRLRLKALSVRYGKTPADSLARDLESQFCSRDTKGHLAHESWLPPELSRFCDDALNWVARRARWSDSLAKAVYDSFRVGFPRRTTLGGWDNIFIGRSEEGRWAIGFLLQVGGSEGFGALCHMDTLSPGTWSYRELCSLTRRFKARLYDGGGFVANGDLFAPYDSIRLAVDKPDFWGKALGGQIAITDRFLRHRPDYIVGSPLSTESSAPLTGVWDILYTDPGERERQSRMAAFQVGTRLVGVIMEQGYSHYLKAVQWTEMSTLSGTVHGTTVRFRPDSYVQTCHGELREAIITGTCTAELRSGQVSRRRFEATRRGQ